MTQPDFRWRDVFDRSPVAMSLVDAQGRQIAGNATYAALLGYELAELDQLDVGRVTRDEDRSWTASYLTQLISGGIDEFVTEKHYVRRDGSTVNARLRAVALRDGEGRCQAVLGVIDPIEPRGRVEDDRLRRFLEFAQSTFTVIDADGAVLETTGRYQSILGYPPEFWETRTIFDLLAPGELDGVLAFREHLLAHPGEPQAIEVEVRSADGARNVLQVHAVNLLDDPAVGGVILTSQNVTEQRRLMADLATRRDTAEAVAEAQTNLLATVSHELRNPLHAVQGLAELLASESLPPRAATLAATLARQLNGLASVTNDLLDTVRLDGGSIVLKVAPTDLHVMVDDVVDYGRAAVGDRPLAITAAIAADVPTWVAADAVRLRQVLRNLVGNAVKFTPSGSVSIEVSQGPGAAIVVSVTDTGVGIPDDEVDTVLQPFTTGSTAGAGRGAGLGLAIVQRLVAAMNGSLRLQSTVGQGSTFRVELPLAAVAAPQAAIAPQPSASACVMVVEDNLVNQQLARSQLDRLGMTAVIVGSGEEALALLADADRPHIDVILMDYQLPGLSGVETTRRLREMDPAIAGLPVVGLTASASAAHRDSFLDAGMDGFLAKPATLDDVRGAIVAALTLRRTQTPAAVDTVPASPSGDRAVDQFALDRLAEEFGDRGVVEGLAAAFLGELDGRGEAITRALADGDTEAASRAAHTLKSSAHLLGALRLARACQTIEDGDHVDGVSLQELLAVTAAELNEWKARTVP